MATAQPLQLQRTPDRERSGKTAIILNANAKRVTPRVRRAVEACAAGADVFYTESLDQADFITRRVADLGYSTVVTGGGDGTVMNTISRVLCHATARGGACPRFGVLRLGTGNAIADWLGARDFRSDLRELHRAPARQMHLIKVNGGEIDGEAVDGEHLTPFAGFGWDAYILNNYERMKRQANRFALTRALFKSVMGYLIAGVGKSVPELIVKRPSWRMKVVNTGGIGFALNARGDVVKRFAPGAVVYEGDVKAACFGTTPFYGFKFRIMPFADRTPGMFQLRVATLSPLAAVANLRKVWTGRIDHPGIIDFQLSGCHVEFERPAPFQIAGDAAGERSAMDIHIARRTVECLHWT